MKKKQTGVILMLAALSLMSIQPVEACTRAVYLGPEQLVITGRTMAWWLVYFSCPNLFIRFPVISVQQWESVFGRNTCLITLPLYVRPLMN